VRRIALDGIISTIAGRGTQPGSYCGDGGPAQDACFNQPIGQNAFPGGRIVFDANYNLYICDTINSRVRRIDAQTDIITTVVGNGTPGFSGDGGAAVDAQIDYPADLAFDPDGNLYIADVDNHCIRRVDTNGVITTFAGQGGQAGFEGDGGRVADSRLFEPFGVMVDPQGNVYIADTKNHRIRIVYK